MDAQHNREQLQSDGIVEGFLVKIQKTEKPELSEQTIELTTKKISLTIQEIDSDFQNINWQAKKAKVSTNFFTIKPQVKSRLLTIANSWELAYKLRKRLASEILHIEPLLSLTVPPLGVSETLQDSHLTKSKKIDWSLEQINVTKVWKKFFLESKPGLDVIIGHPDTHYLIHPELDDNLDNVDLATMLKFIESNHQILNPLTNEGIVSSPTHGTATASVIISAPGVLQKIAKNENIPTITGVAYGSELIPLPVGSSFANLDIFDPSLARAIKFAADQGVDIISISVGGLPSWRLHQAIKYAHQKGVIILAAAGNRLPFVVWPAAYKEVIAVASSNADGKVSQSSSSGSQIDIAAPGESIWCANFEKDKNNQWKLDSKAEGFVGRASGTSFAVAFTAGVAALWLSYWSKHYKDKDNLHKLCGGKENIPLIFKQILDQADTVPTPDGYTWNRNYGKGIIDAEQILQFDPVKFRKNNNLEPISSQNFEHTLESMNLNSELMKEIRSGSLNTILDKLFNKSGDELRSCLQEIGQELAFNIYRYPEQNFHEKLHETLISQNSDPNSSEQLEKLKPELKKMREFLLSEEERENVSEKLRSYLA